MLINFPIKSFIGASGILTNNNQAIINVASSNVDKNSRRIIQLKMFKSLY